MWETALRSRLKGDAAVAALVGTDRDGNLSIDWKVKPQRSPYPAVVLTNGGSDRSQSMAGFISLRRTRLRLRCSAENPAVAAALREAVIAAVVAEAVVDGVTFARAQNIDHYDGTEATDTGLIHQEFISLDLWHS